MPTELHDELAKIGAAWLKRNGFAVVATDLMALGCRERADVIGFRSQCSATIESKVSRPISLPTGRNHIESPAVSGCTASTSARPV